MGQDRVICTWRTLGKFSRLMGFWLKDMKKD
jgi:hypothetical protein